MENGFEVEVAKSWRQEASEDAISAVQRDDAGIHWGGASAHGQQFMNTKGSLEVELASRPDGLDMKPGKTGRMALRFLACSHQSIQVDMLNNQLGMWIQSSRGTNLWVINLEMADLDTLIYFKILTCKTKERKWKLTQGINCLCNHTFTF